MNKFVALAIDSDHFFTNLQQASFEPKTGAALMTQSGLSLRDLYGKPLAERANRSITFDTVLSNPKTPPQSIKFERSLE